MWAWIKLLGNPKNWPQMYSTVKALIELFQAALIEWQRIQEEQAKARDAETAQNALNDLNKPVDPTKTPEQQEQELEDAIRRFRDTLK